MTIRAAILGLGRWGRTLVTSVQGKTDEIRFVAAHAPSAGKIADFCRQHGLRYAADYDEILRDPAIDAVVVASPHSGHFDQVCGAAAAGKHVFTEKPLALDYEGACEAVATIERHGVCLAVGFVRRFHPSIGEVRARLADGRLGTIVGFVGQQTSGTGPYLPRDGWRADPVESPAAAMTGNGVHLLDHMIEFGGRIAGVEAMVTRRGAAPMDDTTSVMLGFRSGATGLLFCTLSTGPNYNFSVYGTRGHAEVSDTTLDQFRFTPLPGGAPSGPVTQPASEIIRNPGISKVQAQMLDFARAIRERRPFFVPVDEVLHGVAVLDAIARSAATRQFVEVPDTG